MSKALRIEVTGFIKEVWEGNDKQSFTYLRALKKRKSEWMKQPGDFPLSVRIIHLKPTEKQVIARR